MISQRTCWKKSHIGVTYVGQAIDDPEIVYLFPRAIVLMCGSESTIIAVKVEVLSFPSNILRHLVSGLTNRHWFLGFDNLPQLLRLARGLKLGGRSDQHIGLRLLSCFTARLEHLQRFVS